MPSDENLNLYGRRTSRVGWHSDDEPLLGECVEANLIVPESFGTCAFFKWKGVSCTTVMQAHSGLTTVMSSFWMVNAIVSFFTVRISVWNRKRLMSRSVGSGGILPPVFSHGQEQRSVCQRVHSVDPFLSWSWWRRRFLGILGAPRSSVDMEE